MNRHVVIAGNIGIGKTSLIQALLNRRPDLFMVVEEPVSKWINSGFLDAFYRNKYRYSIAFQTYVLISRANAYKQCISSRIKKPFVLFDSHFLLDRDIFVKTLVNEWTMSEKDMQLYDAFKAEISEMMPSIDIINYFFLLEGSSESRIRERGRKEEQNINPDYLRQLNNNYEMVFNNLSST